MIYYARNRRSCQHEKNKSKTDISDVQSIRSISKWSIGIEKTENSILKAYYELIQNSKHYIYIEN